MSLANQIIIPIISSKQNLEDQNIFIPTYFTLTPSKHDELPDFAFWRKSSSAFKKFKQKKDRKEKRNHTQNENTDPLPNENQRKCFKLLKKQKNINYALLDFENKMEMPYGYYDPNEAPLYQTHHSNDYQYRQKVQESNVKYEKIDEEMNATKLERVESEPNDEEITVKLFIQPRPDDPFIIIRKENIKKNSKNIKTKQIKKDKNAKNKDIEDADRNKPTSIKPKEYNDHARETIRNEDSSAPQLVRSKTSQSGRMIDENQSDSIESEEPDPSARITISLKKEIYTIQQLMELAKPKNPLEHPKNHREDHSQPLNEPKDDARSKYIQ